MSLVIPIFIPHLGCPHDCLFCNQSRITGTGRSKLPSPPEITETVDLWLKRNQKGRPVQVAFYGGSFTCLERKQQESLLQTIEPYIRDGTVDSIRCSTRPDCIDEDVCSLLSRYHVSTVELGIQSFDDSVLALSKRGHDARQCYRAIELLKTLRFTLGLQLMPGLPGDTTLSILDTVQKAIDVQPDFVRLYPALVIKDSGLEELYRSGSYVPLSLGEAIVITAKCYAMFETAGIEVVRMGLQPSDTLKKSIISGPFHPSFGQLVHSWLILKEMRRRLLNLRRKEILEIHVSHRDLSTVVGNKKYNIRRLQTLGYRNRFKVVVDKNQAKGSVKYVVSQ